MISNCSHDERYRYSGGKAGDQGGEWVIKDWYNRPWTHYIVHPDPRVREEIAWLAEQSALNNNIGYDQGTSGNPDDRYTYWYELKANGYDPTKITKKCETDCSQSESSIVKAAGYRLGIKALQNVSIYNYTGSLREALKKAGFTVYTDKKYLTSPDYIQRGGILLYEGHHVCTNLTDGKYCKTNDDWSEKNMKKLEKGVIPKYTPEIYTFQRLMKSLGYYNMNIDGSYGKGSMNACKAFQGAHQLKETGICDEATWKELLTNTTTK